MRLLKALIDWLASPREKPVYGYILQDWRGRTTYVGITNSPRHRASQHRKNGKRGRLVVVKKKMTRRQARDWEAQRLAAHRRRHGRNPRYNKTLSG